MGWAQGSSRNGKNTEIGYYVFANLDSEDFRSGTKEGLQDILGCGPTHQAITDAFLKPEFKWASVIVEKG